MADRRIALIIAITLTGCSAIFMKPPKANVPNPSCTSSGALPALDATIAIVSAVVAIAVVVQEEREVVIGVPNLIDVFAFGLSASYGFKTAARCRRLRHETLTGPREKAAPMEEPIVPLGCNTLLPALVGSIERGGPTWDATCDLEDARAALPGLGVDEVSATQGIGYPRTIRTVEGARAGAAVRIWFDGDLVAMIEIDQPVLPKPWRKLLFDLDPPDRILDRQWIYAALGLAFVVTEDEQEVEKLLLFRPTTVEHFVEYYALPDAR